MMKIQIKLNIKRSLLSKLVLLAFFCISGVGIAEADTVIFDGSSDISGWTKSGFTYQSWGTSHDLYNSSSGTLTSNSKITLTAGQTFVISAAKRYNTPTPSVSIKYKSELGDDWTEAKLFTSDLPLFSNNHEDLVIDNIIGSYYLQIESTNLSISAIYITDAPTTETAKLTVSPTTLPFGTMRASGSETITVSNTGVGTMDVTIASTNTTDFTLSTTSLTGIGEGQSKTFDVTFNYNGESLGDKATTITVTPSYDAGDAKGIDVTATAADASIWEDFESGIPSTWYNENGSWLNYVTGLVGWASPGYNSAHVLRTPRLYAEEGANLGFDVKITGKYSSNKVTASYSTDRVTWSTPVDYTTDGSYTITAPATGYYWVQFYANQAGIDNMTGWAIADAIHDTRLGTVTIPATGTAHGTYTASVVVKELGGSAETINAELYVGEEKVAKQTGIALAGNTDLTVELSYLPTETFSGQAYIKVTGANIGTLTTDKTDVVISETPYVFDENSDVNPIIATNSVVKIIYTARQGWNTIVMPFSLSASPAYMNTLFGEDWTAYAIYSYAEGNLSFKKTSGYMATTTPFLVYAPNAVAHPDGVYLQGVSAGSYNWNHSNITQSVNGGAAIFKGTFAPIAAPGMEGKFGVTTNGKLDKGNASANIKAYHAYLEIAGDENVRILTIDSEGETTDLGFVRMVDQEAKGVYNLQGQKVEKGRKGIYIVNGKKVVIK